jgi:type IV secretory pathway ATPase VirB11/archaellum biosynthesis ATPase
MTTTILDDSAIAEQSDKQKEYFKKWYATNKLKLSETRKRRYAEETAYRTRVQKAAKKYRVTHIKTKQPRKKTAKITIPELCELSECSLNTFKKFQRLKWIPKLEKTTVFTQVHAKLLSDLMVRARETIYVRSNREALLQPYIDALRANW